MRLLLIFLLLVGCTASPDYQLQHDRLVQHILVETDFEPLQAAILKLQRQDESLIRETIDQLISRLDSIERLDFRPNWDDDAHFFPYRDTNGELLGYGSELAALRTKPFKEFQFRYMHATIQPLEFEGGRFAWALERIMGMYLPPFDENLNQADRNAFKTRVRSLVNNELKRMPTVIKLPQLSDEEKIKIIDDIQVNPRLCP